MLFIVRRDERWPPKFGAPNGGANHGPETHGWRSCYDPSQFSYERSHSAIIPQPLILYFIPQKTFTFLQQKATDELNSTIILVENSYECYFAISESGNIFLSVFVVNRVLVKILYKKK